MTENEVERVMLDLETLGTDRGDAILSLGAVRFDDHAVQEDFYREIDVESCQEAGLRIDANTLKWWMEQDDDVATVLTGGEPLADALQAFTEFFPEDAELWANSPSFDCELLEAAYAAVDQEEPWEFWMERDFRTLKKLPCVVDVEREGNAHDALDDARYQAAVVIKTLQSMSGMEADRDV